MPIFPRNLRLARLDRSLPAFAACVAAMMGLSFAGAAAFTDLAQAQAQDSTAAPEAETAGDALTAPSMPVHIPALTAMERLDLSPPQYTRPDDPWIYRGTDIPQDENWLMGELPNGVRYAVRNSRVPPGQVSLRVTIDAGSLHEESGERGFAHLLEHISFRETDLYKSGEVISYFQRLGARFGLDANASTSATQTSYMLDLPNAQPARVDEALGLFAGMVQRPVITADILASDVAIVLAEAREGGGADRRIIEATQGLFFKGQRIADRSPIGEVEDVTGATPEAVRAFHHKWYRPENTLVVLAGDGDEQMLAALIERYFADWEVAGTGPDEPDFGAPQAPPSAVQPNPVGEALVLVEAGQPRVISFGVMREWTQVVDNLEYNRGNLLNSMATSIINRRFESRARAGGNFLYAGVSVDKTSRSSQGTYVTLSPLGDDWQLALSDVRSVIADAVISPPTQAEIDREMAELRVSFVGMVEQSRIQSTRQLADSVVQAVNIREAVAAPETFLWLFDEMKDRFTPDAILETTQQLFQGEVVRALYLSPEPVEGGEAALRAAMLADVEAFASDDDAETLTFADLPPIGEAAAPIRREPSGVLDIEQLTFANGVKALVWPTSNEPGRATVRVRFGGGWQAISEEDAVYAQLGESTLMPSGIGDLDLDALDRLATGRKLSLGFTIGDGVFEFEGLTRREGVADQLYLFAAKLSQPRWDAGPLERSKASALLTYGAYDANPNGVINRDLDWLLRDEDLRMKKPNPDQLRAATADGFQEVWSRLLKQGPIEVSVFGDIDKEETVLALSRTFGALPRREIMLPPTPAAILAGTEPEAAQYAQIKGFTFPAANEAPRTITHSGGADQAAAIIAWPIGAGPADLPRSRKMQLLAQIFGNRLIEALREEAGASYAPFVASRWPRDATSGGAMFAIGQVEPETMDAFYAEARAIAADLASNGPSVDEVARVVEPMRQVIERAQTGHTFWLNQIEGGTVDPRIVESLFTLWSDFIETTPEEIRSLAEEYLQGHGGYQIAILPQETAQTSAVEAQGLGR